MSPSNEPLRPVEQQEMHTSLSAPDGVSLADVDTLIVPAVLQPRRMDDGGGPAMASTRLPNELAELETQPVPITHPKLQSNYHAAESASPTVGSAHAQPENTTRLAAISTLAQMIGKVLGYGTSLVLFALTARLLSVSQYGDYTVATVYLGFVAVVADCGIAIIAVREASRDLEKLPDLASDAVTLRVILATLWYAAAVAVMWLFLPYSTELKIAATILAISMIFVMWGGGLDIVYQSRLHMQIPAMADYILRFLSLAGVIGIYALTQQMAITSLAKFYLVIGVFAVANIVSFAVRWFGVKPLVVLKWRWQPRIWANMLKLAIPLAIVGLLGQIHYKADTVILSLMVSSRQVAIYGVAYKLVDVLVMFYAVFVNIAYPVLVRYSTHSEGRLRQGAVRVLNMCIAVAVPAVVGTIIMAPGIVYVLGGPAYADAVPAVQVLAVAPLFSFINMVYNYLVVMQNQQKSLIWVSVVGVVANVTLNVLAIPRFSYMGSAVATDITEGLGMALAIIIVVRTLPVGPTIAQLLRTALASSVMAVVLVMGQRMLSGFSEVWGTLVLVTVGTTVWAIVLLAIGGVDHALLERILKRLPFGRHSRIVGDGIGRSLM